MDCAMDLKLLFNVQEVLCIKPETEIASNSILSKSGSLFCPPKPLLPVDNYDEVYPNLILGNRKIVMDCEKLKSLGVTHIVNASMGPKFNQTNTNADFYREHSLEFHGIAAMDNSSFKLYPFFQDAANFIDEALNTNGKVYVHCQQGMSRSATIVLAFLMLKRDIDLLTATKLIRSKRLIYPNEGFIKQLCQFQETLCRNKTTITESSENKIA